MSTEQTFRITMGRGRWNVLAQWFGTERVVYFDPCIFECFRYVRNNTPKEES